uniref:GFA family protein n=1 Tax=Halopseudomonas salegens TaxID=1434072 RepID=UPI001E37DA32|nr:GFA family protein [Halopseudomonas salegens]
MKFEIEGELEPVQVCHCSQCRKAQGSAFATNIPVSVSAYRLLEGSDLLTEFESSPGKQRVFCKVCGSPLFSKRTDLPHVLRVRAGTLDGDLATRPVAHFYYASKANWFELNDDVAKFPEAYVPPE